MCAAKRIHALACTAPNRAWHIEKPTVYSNWEKACCIRAGSQWLTFDTSPRDVSTNLLAGQPSCGGAQARAHHVIVLRTSGQSLIILNNP